MKDAALRFALRTAGSSGITFDRFRRWLSPWGWNREGLAAVLRSMSEEGLTNLEEDEGGSILAIKLTEEGERILTATALPGGDTDP